MRKRIKITGVIILAAISLLMVYSCSKDETDPGPQKTLGEQLVGSWQLTDGDYTGTLTFEASYNASDVFFADAYSGWAVLSWRLTDNNLTITSHYVIGDYEEYNDVGADDIINATISIDGDELTLTYGSDVYVYTKVPDEDILSESDLLGTWVKEDGNYKDFISFELADLAFNTGGNSFTAESDTGAATILWDIGGNMLLIYYYDYFFGDYESYNEVSFGDTKVLLAAVSGGQLHLTVDGITYDYIKFSEDYAVYRADLNETIWEYSLGDYDEIISFHFYDPTNKYSGANSFIDNSSTGATDDFLWTVCGDLLTINYRSFMLGDYSVLTGISRNDVKTYSIEVTAGGITIDSKPYVTLPIEKTIDPADLIGTWQITDGNYTGTLTMVDGLSTDAFVDGVQSGSAEFSWYLNGNMLSMYFDGTMTGDYESYNGTSQYDSYTTEVSVSGNELSIESEGTTYTYTKLP